MKKAIIIVSLLLLAAFALLITLSYVPAFLIANYTSCEIEINERFIDSGCSLDNGVYFEKLHVIEKDTAGIPSKYHVTTRFSCSNPGVVSSFTPDRIYFHKRNRHYRWGADSFHIYYERKGRDVRAIGYDSVINETYTRTVAFSAEGLALLRLIRLSLKRIPGIM